jgi:hypothetical protein
MARFPHVCSGRIQEGGIHLHVRDIAHALAKSWDRAGWQRNGQAPLHGRFILGRRSRQMSLRDTTGRFSAEQYLRKNLRRK